MSGNSSLENNSVNLVGKVISSPEFSHEVYGEGFYIVYIQVPRLSANYDNIPVMFSERLVSPDSIDETHYLIIEGQFCHTIISTAIAVTSYVNRFCQRN